MVHKNGTIIAVSKDDGYALSKPVCPSIHLVKGLGVEGDAHCGKSVKYRSRGAHDPSQPNLRQVHLIHAELFDELTRGGFDVTPGVMGENITTRGIDLLGLPRGAQLLIGTDTVIEVTGLRNPCKQLNDYQSGLMNAVLDKDVNGGLIRKSGVMAIVIAGGAVTAGDIIKVSLPAQPHEKLERV